MAFLDENGLSHLWLKITNKITDMLPGVFKGATTSAAGETGTVPAPSAGAATRYLRSDGTWAVPPGETYDDFDGASSSAAGKSGLVPAPAAGAATRYLRSDGTWAVPPDTNTTYTEATASQAGLMSAANFSKLAAFSAASEYAKKSDISSVYRYKGSVANAAALPTSGQAVGDTYNIESASSYGGAGMNVAWNGTAWDPLGEKFVLETISNADIDEICV